MDSRNPEFEKTKRIALGLYFFRSEKLRLNWLVILGLSKGRQGKSHLSAKYFNIYGTVREIGNKCQIEHIMNFKFEQLRLNGL